MAGLLALSRRHFAVLTNFMENVMESRLIGPEAAFQGYIQGGPSMGPTGPGGWDIPVPAAEHCRTRAQPLSPPTPGPAGLPGPASLG